LDRSQALDPARCEREQIVEGREEWRRSHEVRVSAKGGVAQRDELIWGPVEAIAGQVKEAEATVGRGLLIAPGCSVPPRVREAHLRAMLEAA